jgi:hypothetical protein
MASRWPFVAADDGIAAGEPTECFNPVAVAMRAEALSRKEGHVGAVAFGRTGDPCACRKSNSPIQMMQSAEDWAAKNTPCPFNSTR